MSHADGRRDRTRFENYASPKQRVPRPTFQSAPYRLAYPTAKWPRVTPLVLTGIILSGLLAGAFVGAVGVGRVLLAPLLLAFRLRRIREPAYERLVDRFGPLLVNEVTRVQHHGLRL